MVETYTCLIKKTIFFAFFFQGPRDVTSVGSSQALSCSVLLHWVVLLCGASAQFASKTCCRCAVVSQM